MKQLYFIRVGGSAMGPVAAAVQKQGNQIVGSEEVIYDPIKTFLESAGVRVIPSFSPDNLDEVNPDAVVVGNAVSRGNPELERALNLRLPLISLPQLVSESMIDRNKSIVVAGTHGKTTTTAMTAWLLRQAGREPGWLIGGLPGNGMEPCRPVPADRHNTSKGIFVIEGDEYDSAFWDKRSKFLWYRPTTAIINSIELDHTDIFESLDAIKKSFRLFARLVPQNGLLLIRAEDTNVREVVRDSFTTIQTFGHETGDWQMRNWASRPEGSSFEIWRDGQLWLSVDTKAPGLHNAINLTAACAAAHWEGLTQEEIKEAAASFSLPKRRMEEIGTYNGATVVDDFAHHPTAIVETLRSAKSKYPGGKIWAVFEPRSNSTTRNIFQGELTASFSGASGLFLGPLDRPERYQPSERLDTSQMASELAAEGVETEVLGIQHSSNSTWGDLAEYWLKSRVGAGDVVLLMSNGNLGGLRSILTKTAAATDDLAGRTAP